MPQVPSRALPAKKLIPASFPPDATNKDMVTKEQKDRWIKDMEEKRAERDAAVARSTTIPTKATAVLKIEIRKYGSKYWNVFIVEGRKERPLCLAPTNLPGMLGAIEAHVGEECLKL